MLQVSVYDFHVAPTTFILTTALHMTCISLKFYLKTSNTARNKSLNFMSRALAGRRSLVLALFILLALTQHNERHCLLKLTVPESAFSDGVLLTQLYTQWYTVCGAVVSLVKVFNNQEMSVTDDVETVIYETDFMLVSQ